MPLTKKEIDLLRKGFKDLETKFNLDELEDEIDDNLEYVYFPFPKEEAGVEVETDELLFLFEDLESFKIHNYNKVTTDRITQRVITASDLGPIFYLGLLHSTTKEGISLQIVTEPILIGIAATKKDEFSKYHPPCSSHVAVEVKYPKKEDRLNDKDEEKLIKSFFFELSHIYKIGFSFSTFHHPEDYDEEELEEQIKNLPNSPADYNPGMDLFVQANQAISEDLRFLTYYKIFEYFAPFYSKIDAFEAMRKKLDSSNSTTLDADYIASIFDLTKNYEKSIRDKELVKSLIDNTFDLVDIYKDLPLSIRNRANLKNLEYKTKRDTKDRVINHLGNALYTTRNAIVHAKSNFESSGIECPENDLEQLNVFMHKACYSTIKWYNRLPKHLKIT
ncbi:hypothetical protein GCM10023115_24910 [Pontixanthobacter gangjinensis]|uniref:Uncharacterized protein n=1 Tax=Christiangramia aestuarii TaxID=1028746 RepID=A0A7K1LSZ8_9FLAO|nr:hypothetical protein [Christiangramia aestuarii]MUP43876.1 hypothetical protein [Christiangramia aestuarii]